MTYDNIFCLCGSKYAGCSPVKTTAGNLLSYELLKNLTDPCRYNKMNPPGPLNISTRMYIYNSQAVNNVRYNLHLLLQFEYRDPRLAYHSISRNVYEIIGGEDLQEMIWTPRIYLGNDHSSTVMGSLKKDISVSVYPDGTIIFSQRLKTAFTCWMKLHKFPFDEQHCSLMIESWVYNANELVLKWVDDNPVSITPNIHMSEYYISSMWNSTSKESSFQNTNFYDYRHSVGSSSALMVTFHLRRQVGYYIMDYYVPSTLLVIISWVSFWLDANAISGRINLGISTMLTFITLSSQTGSAMPKVSYSMASEVWFIVCTTFIIGSLVEFAFVNTIWRRRSNVELKKVSGKYILKSTLTPKLARKELKEHTSAVQHSVFTLTELPSTSSSLPASLITQIPFRFLALPPMLEDDDEEQEQVRDFPLDSNNAKKCRTVIFTSDDENPTNGGFTTMTPQQIAKWIDARSRVIFPVSFLIFNTLYWGVFSWM
ncbi:hypothetical protein B7P43_G05192 [Cryptotermes secundus]|uniref:Uncharacterized protein n=1 Tax=Cryptotermes secundus TaxID=105785 RepID=A0A2J7QAC2_9NEOP|nr:hypothetical protein B7P43_G05192 [Cryptotermes secundus]